MGKTTRSFFGFTTHHFVYNQKYQDPHILPPPFTDKLNKFNVFQLKFGLFKSTKNMCDIGVTYVFTDDDEPELIEPSQIQQFNNIIAYNSISQSQDNLTTSQQAKHITLLPSCTLPTISPLLSISYQDIHIQHEKNRLAFRSDSKERYLFVVIAYYF